MMLGLIILAGGIGLAIQVWIITSILKLNERVEILTTLVTGDDSSTPLDETLREAIERKRRE